jgi:hypothetical protein
MARDDLLTTAVTAVRDRTALGDADDPYAHRLRHALCRGALSDLMARPGWRLAFGADDVRVMEVLLAKLVTPRPRRRTRPTRWTRGRT